MDIRTTNKGRQSKDSVWRRGLANLLRAVMRPRTPAVFMRWLKVATAIFQFFD